MHKGIIELSHPSSRQWLVPVDPMPTNYQSLDFSDNVIRNSLCFVHLKCLWTKPNNGNFILFRQWISVFRQQYIT